MFFFFFFFLKKKANINANEKNLKIKFFFIIIKDIGVKYVIYTFLFKLKVFFYKYYLRLIYKYLLLFEKIKLIFIDNHSN